MRSTGSGSSRPDPPRHGVEGPVDSSSMDSVADSLRATRDPTRPSRSAGPYRSGCAPDVAEHADVREAVALQVGPQRPAPLPPPVGKMLAVLRLVQPPHGLARATQHLRHMLRVGECAAASTTADAVRAGWDDLKIPDPTKTASATNCITRAATDGVTIPPAQNSGNSNRPVKATSCPRPIGRRAPSPRRRARRVGLGEGPMVPDGRRWRTASTMFPVPASPFERIIAGPRTAAKRLAEIGRAADEGHHEGPLSMWFASSPASDLGLVDEVDAEGLRHLRLGEVADTGLGHHRDRDRVDDSLDQQRVAHTRHTTVTADVQRHTLEGHDRGGTGVSAILACSALTTSMMTPPRSMSAKPR